MKKQKYNLIGLFGFLFMSFNGLSQTNVFDNVIAPSPSHTYLEAALIQANLVTTLQNPNANLTVFAPDDAAFTALATALGTDITGLLASPLLTNILTYHVLGAEVVSGSLTNGQIAAPLNTANTLKVTIDGTNVFINQAQVTAADIQADNGVVHVLNAVVLPVQTIADLAIGSPAHTILVAAVVEARLLPALTNPFASLTAFAPTNDAFNSALAALGITSAELLASPDLESILLYHVLGSQVLSTALTSGPVATLNGANVTVTVSPTGVTINDANVIAADLTSGNGVVHVIDGVLLPPAANVNENNSVSVEVYPNPCQETVRIITDVPSLITIKDLNGKVIFSAEIETSAELDMNNYNQGTYFFNISNSIENQTRTVVKY